MTGHQPTVTPVLRYEDPRKALRWLHDAFGFEQTLAVPGEGDTIVHAEMSFGNGKIMFGSGKGDKPDTDFTSTPFGIYVTVTDADEHCARARGAGATITMELTDMDYGSREYAAQDFEGNHWFFGTYQPTVS